MKKGKFVSFLVVLIALVVGLLAVSTIAVRMAPSDPAVWHVDPLTAQPPVEKGSYIVRPSGGNAVSRKYPGTPKEVLEQLDAIALSTPRTRRLAGSVAEGRITYITRSKAFGFPDYTTVTAFGEKKGTAIAVFAQMRFGRDDFGVNQARVEDWLTQLGR